MRASRRFLALATLLAVTWTALWPLVSSARLLAAGEEMMLCHQAGTQVSPDQAPRDPNAPAERTQHCPLCIMSFFVSFSMPVTAPEGAATAATLGDTIHCAEPPAGVHTRIPQGRAPPRFS